jgi:hypothetical protein
MQYHAIAVLPGDRRKSIVNKSESQMLTDVIISYVSNGVIQARWGEKTQSYQVIDLRIYKTDKSWDKRDGIALETFIGKAKNIFKAFEKRAEKTLGKKSFRVFIIMPIQGEKHGSQNDQRIYEEYDKRFETLEKMLGSFSCVAIRIDKEHPLEDLVGRIKDEIKKSKFVIADLTDERPSCYFEAGYAEASKKPIIYVASKESVITPGNATKVHFDIHMNVNYFTNRAELTSKVKSAIEKNREILFKTEEERPGVVLGE